jgi:hydroxymethylbilane synthase
MIFEPGRAGRSNATGRSSRPRQFLVTDRETITASHRADKESSSMDHSRHPIRLGTRGSDLARWQADWVAELLRAAGIQVELVLITTQGDQSREPIGAASGQGLFTKEIQRALLDDRADLAVHSLKDLPTQPVDGLQLTAVPRRASCSDVLVSAQAASFDQLAPGARLGTGSMRRRAQLLHARDDLLVRGMRGNVDTRLRQLDRGQFDAIVLAEAGLRRLGLEDRISQVLPRSWMLPAVGQGALGLETRADDLAVREAIAPLNDPDSYHAVLAERSMLDALNGGCLAPIGAWAEVQHGRLRLRAAVLSADGQQRITAEVAGAPTDAVPIGREVAGQLKAAGAEQLILSARQ